MNHQQVAGPERYGISQVNDLVLSPHLHQLLGATGLLGIFVAGGSGCRPR